MKRNIILSTLAAALLGTAALQVQAQGIYVNKKNGESISYPKAILDKVVPMASGTSVTTYETGVTATLKYEKIADMKTARMGHQVFPSGNGFVVVGGHTTDFQLTKTAEIYQNGKWTDIAINNPHDGAFSVILDDGRVMVGGGFSSKNGVGQSKVTDIYDPKTQTFTAGPDMTVARAYSKAVLLNGKVYVNGNWYADNTVMDCYDGSSFKSVGKMLGFSLPYIFTSKNGVIWTWSRQSCDHGEVFEFGTTKEGYAGLKFDEFLVSSGSTGTYLFTGLAVNVPINLSDDVRPSNSYSPSQDEYFFLTKNSDGDYKLNYTSISTDQIGTYKLEIPKVYPNTQTAIDYRGSVFVNDSKNEVYLIGASGTSSNQTVYLMSFNYSNGYWTIAKAEGFSHNLMSGAWTLLNDGRLACTGGSINSNFDAQKFAYIFTPPTAGLSDNSGSKEYGVNVYKQDGNYDTYMESELESITTYEEEFDERITQEIPVEYLSKMSAYMPIYSGNTPPNVEGTYEISPYTTVYDQTGYYDVGRNLSEKIIKMYNQDMTKNTLQWEEKQGSSHSTATDVALLGNGKDFTAFFITTGTSSGISTKRATIISGTWSSDGIKNFYYGFVMLDKGADPDHKLMDVGYCRIFKDGDAISTPTSWSARQRDARTDNIFENETAGGKAPLIERTWLKEKASK